MIIVMMYVFIAMQLLGALATVALIGKDRKPTTPGTGVIAVAAQLTLALCGVYAILRG